MARTAATIGLRRVRRAAAGIVAGAVAIALLQGCQSSTTGNSTNSAKPVRGGTLTIAGQDDVGPLDPVVSYDTNIWTLLRMVSRQLTTYPASGDENVRYAPTGDLATYQVSPDGLTYTFTIRPGVQWDAPSGARAVTSADVILGIKRLCNPVAPAPALQYWTATISGLQSFCDGFLKVKGTVPAIKAYVQSHQISGVTAPDASTVVFKLDQPASDFLNLMAIPMASPAPVEYLDYLPGSADLSKHLISDGPYTITSYQPGTSYLLERNPAWKASSDPIRKAYVDKISVKLGLSDTAIQQQLQTGEIDMSWDTYVSNTDVHTLTAANDKNLFILPGAHIAYIPFNMQSNADNGALKKTDVRQALEYCVDRGHLVQILGGSKLARSSTQILVDGLTGYDKSGALPVGESGDAAKCKSMLATAGYPTGLTLRMVYQNQAPYDALAQAIQSDMAKAGVTIKLSPLPTGGQWYSFMTDTNNVGKWDLSLAHWGADWAHNAARSFFAPLLDGRSYGTGSVNYGDYNNPTVNSDIDAALATKTADEAASAWAKADKDAMADPPWIPLAQTFLAIYAGKKLGGGASTIEGMSGIFDPTNVWVK